MKLSQRRLNYLFLLISRVSTVIFSFQLCLLRIYDKFCDIIETDVFFRDYTIPKTSSHERVMFKISSTRAVVNCSRICEFM